MRRPLLLTALALTLASCHDNGPVLPERPTLDVSPQLLSISSGEWRVFRVVAIDRIEMPLYDDVTNAKVTSSDTMMLRVVGNQLVGIGSNDSYRATLTIEGDWRGRHLVGHRTISVVPAFVHGR